MAGDLRYSDCDVCICYLFDVVRMNEREIEQRKLALQRTCGVCVVCGKPLIQGYAQYAHKIPNKEMFRKKYGSWVIDHTLNGEMVDSLECNATVDVGSSYGNHLEVIADILIYEYEKTWGLQGLGKLVDKLTKKYLKLGDTND